MDQRIRNEMVHGKKLAATADRIWYWQTPAGKERWRRRASMLAFGIGNNALVLEVGCGESSLASELKEKQAEIIAIDISLELLKIAKENNACDNINFVCSNAYKSALNSATFDVVVGNSVLHHLNLDAALEEFYRVLKPDGAIFFAEPNMLNPQIAVEKNVPFIKKMAHSSPDETAFIRWKLLDKLKQHGFKSIKIKNFDFLHPSIPKILVPFMKKVGYCLESIPLIREISGSLYIEARKPITGSDLEM
ncbi:MAG: class I SAM-dependent methyltransferase [Candidatus Omnitrophica bacterium]|nr:class I SAM-dependent methyltransferase [Candidatus Omnitrophota bacterium]